MVDALRTRLEEACNILSRRLVRHTSVALLSKGPCDKVIAEGASCSACVSHEII